MTDTYSFQNVTASLAGPTGTVDLGYGAGVAEEGISIDMAGDKNTMTIGADGNGMHSQHADKSGTVTVRLLKTSPNNSILQQFYDEQALNSAIWGLNVIVIQQTASGDITTCQPAAFKRKPTLNYRKDGDFLEWTFDAIAIDTVLGQY
jgi:hypothetical protein